MEVLGEVFEFLGRPRTDILEDGSRNGAAVDLLHEPARFGRIPILILAITGKIKPFCA
jgi:hypothetical protein